jgi:C1A family cysteine protease
MYFIKVKNMSMKYMKHAIGLLIIFSSLSSSFLNAQSQKKWLPGVRGYISTTNKQAQNSDLIPRTRGVSTLPIRFTLREFAPSVEEQEGGTCVGWATTYAGMSILENIKFDRRDKMAKDSNAFSPYFTYLLGKFSFDDKCEEGMYIEKALSTLQNVGAVKNTDFNNFCLLAKNRFGLERVILDTSDKVSINNLISKVKENRLQNFIPIAGNNIVQNVKHFLNRKMPVIIGSEMYTSIVENLVSNVWNGVKDDYPGGHAMCVIGYDDSKFGGAFEIMNSWGKEYGDDGFIWFRYTDFANVVDAAYALTGIESKVNPETEFSNFNITVSAVGTKTSRLLPTSIDRNYDFYRSKELSNQNSLLNRYAIVYTEDDDGYRLNITSESLKSFYVYAFSFSQEHVNIETSLADNDEVLQSGSGIIIPANPYSNFIFSKFGEKREYCILISKVKLENEQLINSIKKSYSSLTEYLQQNFNSFLVINKPKVDFTFDNKMQIVAKYEPNEILPILITHSFDKNKYDLFKSTELNISDYALREKLSDVLEKFKNSKKSKEQFELTANFKVQKVNNTYSIMMYCIKEDTLEDLFSLFIEGGATYIQSKPYLFQFSFTGDINTIGKKFQDLLFSNLTKAKVPFVFSN